MFHKTRSGRDHDPFGSRTDSRRLCPIYYDISLLHNSTLTDLCDAAIMRNQQASTVPRETSVESNILLSRYVDRILKIKGTDFPL
jgi:hypothetical protein